MLVEPADNLIGFDAVSPDLDLIVKTPQKSDVSVGQKPAEVARSIQPVAGH